jgi:hypothetical protein
VGFAVWVEDELGLAILLHVAWAGGKNSQTQTLDEELLLLLVHKFRHPLPVLPLEGVLQLVILLVEIFLVLYFC